MIFFIIIKELPQSYVPVAIYGYQIKQVYKTGHKFQITEFKCGSREESRGYPDTYLQHAASFSVV